MECFLQYLDDLDDFVYATALLWERILHISTFMILVTGSVAVQALGVYLALTAPPPAVAVVFVLLVVLLYRGVVYHSPVPKSARS
jgi:uncharacterized membrane protein YfcA